MATTAMTPGISATSLQVHAMRRIFGTRRASWLWFGVAVALIAGAWIPEQAYEEACGSCVPQPTSGRITCGVRRGNATVGNAYRVGYRVRAWLPSLSIVKLEHGPALVSAECTQASLRLLDATGVTREIPWAQLASYVLRPMHVDGHKVVRRLRVPIVPVTGIVLLLVTVASLTRAYRSK